VSILVVASAIPVGNALNGSRAGREGEKLTVLVVILRPCGKEVNQLAYLWFQRAGKFRQLPGFPTQWNGRDLARSQRMFLVMWDVSDKIASEFCQAEDKPCMLTVQASSRRLRASDTIPHFVKRRPD
jgi:hypothetical protein